MPDLMTFLEKTEVWAVLLTLLAYGTGTFLQNRVKKVWCNPLLIACITLVVFLSLAGIPYGLYKEKTAVLSYMMLPATVSLAVPLYEQWQRLKENVLAIICGIGAGALTSVVCVVAMAWVFRLEPEYAVSLMPKSVTTAIGADVAAELGGIAALTTGVIILTGIVGNLLATSLCKVFRITDPVAKGIAIGTASHAIGTSKALEMGQVEGAMSGLAIALAGIMTAVICPLLTGLLP